MAIELDDETRQFLCNLQEQFKLAEVRGNYSFSENLHLTIKFLGEIDQDQSKKISSMIKSITLRHQAFDLSIDSIGRFNKGNKMILWAGIKNNESLFKLYQDVDNSIESVVSGVENKSYSPHITLVREAVCPKTFSEIKETTKSKIQTFTAVGLSLMESTRVNGKLTYIRRAFEPFQME